MRLGASSYLLKPFERAELLVTVEKALAEGALRRDNANLRDLLRRKQADSGMVGGTQVLNTSFRTTHYGGASAGECLTLV